MRRELTNEDKLFIKKHLPGELNNNVFDQSTLILAKKNQFCNAQPNDRANCLYDLLMLENDLSDSTDAYANVWRVFKDKEKELKNIFTKKNNLKKFLKKQLKDDVYNNIVGNFNNDMLSAYEDICELPKDKKLIRLLLVYNKGVSRGDESLGIQDIQICKNNNQFLFNKIESVSFSNGISGYLSDINGLESLAEKCDKLMQFIEKVEKFSYIQKLPDAEKNQLRSLLGQLSDAPEPDVQAYFGLMGNDLERDGEVYNPCIHVRSKLHLMIFNESSWIEKINGLNSLLHQFGDEDSKKYLKIGFEKVMLEGLLTKDHSLILKHVRAPKKDELKFEDTIKILSKVLENSDADEYINEFFDENEYNLLKQKMSARKQNLPKFNRETFNDIYNLFQGLSNIELIEYLELYKYIIEPTHHTLPPPPEPEPPPVPPALSVEEIIEGLYPKTQQFIESLEDKVQHKIDNSNLIFTFSDNESVSVSCEDFETFLEKIQDNDFRPEQEQSELVKLYNKIQSALRPTYAEVLKKSAQKRPSSQKRPPAQSPKIEMGPGQKSQQNVDSNSEENMLPRAKEFINLLIEKGVRFQINGNPYANNQALKSDDGFELVDGFNIVGKENNPLNTLGKLDQYMQNRKNKEKLFEQYQSVTSQELPQVVEPVGVQGDNTQRSQKPPLVASVDTNIKTQQLNQENENSSIRSHSVSEPSHVAALPEDNQQQVDKQEGIGVGKAQRSQKPPLVASVETNIKTQQPNQKGVNSRSRSLASEASLGSQKPPPPPPPPPPLTALVKTSIKPSSAATITPSTAGGRLFSKRSKLAIGRGAKVKQAAKSFLKLDQKNPVVKEALNKDSLFNDFSQSKKVKIKLLQFSGLSGMRDKSALHTNELKKQLETLDVENAEEMATKWHKKIAEDETLNIKKQETLGDKVTIQTNDFGQVLHLETKESHDQELAKKMMDRYLDNHCEGPIYINAKSETMLKGVIDSLREYKNKYNYLPKFDLSHSFSGYDQKIDMLNGAFTTENRRIRPGAGG